MKPPSPRIRSLAQRLLEVETGPQPSPEQVAAGVDAICRKLSGHLVPMVGRSGFQVLLARALHLACSEFPLLEGVRVNTTSSMCVEGLAERLQGRELREAWPAVVTMLACFFRLVAHFMGDDLALRIVSRVWPDLAPGHAYAAFERQAGNGSDRAAVDRRSLQLVVDASVGAPCPTPPRRGIGTLTAQQETPVPETRIARFRPGLPHE